MSDHKLAVLIDADNTSPKQTREMFDELASYGTLTVAVLAAAPVQHAGVASGINNAVARSGALLAVAALPALVGLSGAEYRDPAALTEGYHRAMLVASGMLVVGGVISWFGLQEAGRLSETHRLQKESGST